MTYVLHCYQTGFIKSRLASHNVSRLLHIIEGLLKSSPCAVLCLDAEKAFGLLDRLVLSLAGVGPQYISMIKVIYANPTVRVLVGSTFSDMF